MELLERTSFLQTLRQYAGEARNGDGRLVLLSGESGIGKTALLEAFQQELSGVAPARRRRASRKLGRYFGCRNRA
jgi:predicted ATPase